MTDRIERRLPEILTQISVPQVPDYTDDILGLTARRRQRPGWTFPGRWLPMDITAPRPVVAGTQWRPIVILILLILLLAATVVLHRLEALASGALLRACGQRLTHLRTARRYLRRGS